VVVLLQATKLAFILQFCGFVLVDDVTIDVGELDKFMADDLFTPSVQVISGSAEMWTLVANGDIVFEDKNHNHRQMPIVNQQAGPKVVRKRADIVKEAISFFQNQLLEKIGATAILEGLHGAVGDAAKLNGSILGCQFQRCIFLIVLLRFVGALVSEDD
jgi:hypothetical protein